MERDDDGALATKEQLGQSVFHSKETIYFKARPGMDCMRARNKGQCVDGGAHEAIVAKISQTAKDKEVFISAFKSAHFSVFTSPASSDSLSHAMKTHCPCQNLAEMLEIDGVSLHGRGPGFYRTITQ